MSVSARVPILAMILGAVGLGCLVCTLQAQTPVRDLQVLEGPWECRNRIGIHGVFISALTSLTEKGSQQGITSQSISLRVYERKEGQEHSGYFSPSGDPNGSTVFESKRLIIHIKYPTDIPAFDLDVRFDPAIRHWSGFWSLCNKSQDVVLSRPRPKEGVHPSTLVGNWEGYSDPTTRFRFAPGTLHISQGYDGSLTAWLDRTLSRYDPRAQSTHADQRNGEQLSVLSATHVAIVLETVNPLGANYRYEGTFSGDGKSLSGQWQSTSGSGGTLNAPTLYRLVDQSVGGN
jgi:hypothetical protein